MGSSAQGELRLRIYSLDFTEYVGQWGVVVKQLQRGWGIGLCSQVQIRFLLIETLNKPSKANLVKKKKRVVL